MKWFQIQHKMFHVCILNWPFLLDMIHVNGDVDGERLCWRRPTRFAANMILTICEWWVWVQSHLKPSLQYHANVMIYTWSRGCPFCHWQSNHHARLATDLNKVHSSNIAEQLPHCVDVYVAGVENIHAHQPPSFHIFSAYFSTNLLSYSWPLGTAHAWVF